MTHTILLASARRSLYETRSVRRASGFVLVAYADDFVILSRGYAEQAREWTERVMSRIGLTLNEQKTSVRDARSEEFDCLHLGGVKPSPLGDGFSAERRGYA